MEEQGARFSGPHAAAGADWLARESRWFEKSDEPSYGLGPVYVVCLASRLDHVRKFLEKNGLSGRVSILRAFTPDQVDITQLLDLGVLSPHFRRRVGANKSERSLCCAISHLACWFDAWVSQSGPSLFLEDDVAWEDQSASASALVDSASFHPWELLYFAYSHAKEEKCRVVTPDLIQLRGQLCTNAYALSASALGSLLNSAFPIEMAVDQYMRDHAEAENLTALGAKSLLFVQDRALVESSFGKNRVVPAPIWNPVVVQKLLSRAQSLLTFSGGAGYDETIFLIDRHRHGELNREETRRPVIRAWDVLQRIRSV